MNGTRVGTRARTVASELWSDGRGWVLVGVSAGWFLSTGVRLVFPALLPALRGEFGISLTVSGVLISTIWFTYAVGQLPSGIVRDRVGDRITLTVSTAVTAATVAVVGLSVDTLMLFAGAVLFASSTALFGPTRYTVLSEIYPERDGTAIGISLAAGNAGNALLPATAGVLAAAASWRLGFGVTVPLFVLTAVFLWWAVPEVSTDTDSPAEELSLDVVREILRVLRRREILVLTGVLILTGFVWQGFAGFYVTYLVTAKGLSPSLAATLFSLFFLVGVGVQPVAGGALDRYGPRVSLVAVVAAIVPVFVLLPIASTLPGFVGLSVLASSILGIRPIANTHLVSSLPPDMRGTSFGLLRTVVIMIASAGPVTVGALADAGYFDGAFLLLGAVATVALILSTRLSTGAG